MHSIDIQASANHKQVDHIADKQEKHREEGKTEVTPRMMFTCIPSRQVGQTSSSSADLIIEGLDFTRSIPVFFREARRDSVSALRSENLISLQVVIS